VGPYGPGRLQVGHMRNAHRNLIVNPEENSYLGELRVQGRIVLKWILGK
jgi:hypothetical protein